MKNVQLYKRCIKCGIVYIYPRSVPDICSRCEYTYHRETSWGDPYWQCPKCNNYHSPEEQRCNCGFVADFGLKKSDGCFITTAALISLGKSENCLELNVFRHYRDNWLKNNFPELIDEYYKIAPILVKNINKQSNKDEIFSKIWFDHLEECYQLIRTTQFYLCKEKYEHMVFSLKNKYCK